MTRRVQVGGGGFCCGMRRLERRGARAPGQAVAMTAALRLYNCMHLELWDHYIHFRFSVYKYSLTWHVAHTWKSKPRTGLGPLQRNIFFSNTAMVSFHGFYRL